MLKMWIYKIIRIVKKGITALEPFATPIAGIIVLLCTHNAIGALAIMALTEARSAANKVDKIK